MPIAMITKKEEKRKRNKREKGGIIRHVDHSSAKKGLGFKKIVPLSKYRIVLKFMLVVWESISFEYFFYL